MHCNSAHGMVILTEPPVLHQPSIVLKASDGLFYRVESPHLIGGYLSTGRWSSGTKNPLDAKTLPFRAKGGPRYV